MPGSNLQYMVRTRDNKEYGPVDQDTLVLWAQSGRITTHCQVRNKLLKKWTSAEKIPFLKDVVQPPEEEVRKARGGLSAKINRFLTRQEPTTTQKTLRELGTFKFTPAGPTQRFVAWLMDMSILLGVGAATLAGTYFAVQRQMISSELGYTVFSSGFFLFALLYYILYWGLSAQTFGQWFWGIMIVRTEGEPVLLTRAFLYTLLYFVFGLTTFLPTVVLPSRRAIQDKLAGVRVVRITVSTTS